LLKRCHCCGKNGSSGTVLFSSKWLNCALRTSGCWRSHSRSARSGKSERKSQILRSLETLSEEASGPRRVVRTAASAPSVSDTKNSPEWCGALCASVEKDTRKEKEKNNRATRIIILGAKVVSAGELGGAKWRGV